MSDFSVRSFSNVHDQRVVISLFLLMYIIWTGKGSFKLDKEIEDHTKGVTQIISLHQIFRKTKGEKSCKHANGMVK